MYAQVNTLEWGTILTRPTINHSKPTNLYRSPAMIRKEIEMLRKEMEFAVLSGQPFTSHEVVTISQELDRKLVEYMKIQRNAI